MAFKFLISRFLNQSSSNSAPLLGIGISFVIIGGKIKYNGTSCAVKSHFQSTSFVYFSTGKSNSAIENFVIFIERKNNITENQCKREITDKLISTQNLIEVLFGLPVQIFPSFSIIIELGHQ